MQAEIITAFFLILLTALLGGMIAKLLKLQPIIGYILSGIVLGVVFTQSIGQLEKLAQVGAILLLFSVGLELSIKSLGRIWRVAVIGGLIQIFLTALILFVFLSFGFGVLASGIVAFGFALSSTAIVVKTLADRGEMDTIHGELMVGWLLVQDLAVIPLMVIIPAISGGGNLLTQAIVSVVKAGFVIAFVLILGKIIVPFFLHKVSQVGSRELLVISALVIAIGTALITSFFGISPILGAFLAGVVISDSQENHAVFSETRPLRDLFVAMFFVTLGMTIQPQMFMNNIIMILGISLLVILTKFIVFIFVNYLFKYHGKTAVISSLGLSHVGEFAFIIFSSAVFYDLISEELSAVAAAVAMVTIIMSPFLFKGAVPLWRWIKGKSGPSNKLSSFIVGNDKKSDDVEPFKGHIIICGYGRVGRWVGKALENAGVVYVVIDYSQKAIAEAKEVAVPAIYGDPSDPEVLEEAGIADAKAVIAAIPDRITQEELITCVQTLNPSVKIISRAHFDDEWMRYKFLRVDKVVQPEFEAAVAISKSILLSMGKSKSEIENEIKSLRLSRSQAKS